MMTTYEIREAAYTLYDGGWRSTDADQIAAEYELTAEEAAAICEQLADLEADAQ